MIITEFMENGSLDTFLKVSQRGQGSKISKSQMLTGVTAESLITPYITSAVAVLNAF